MKTMMLTLLSFFCAIPLAISQMDILQCYHKLPIGKTNPIKQNKKNPKVYETITDLGDTMQVSVDLKNGFIEWEDAGTGGGVTYLQVAKFKKEDGSQIVIYKQNGSDGMMNDMKWQSFLVQKDQLVEVKKVLPTLSINDFLEKPVKEVTATASEQFFKFKDLKILLPKVGTTIVIKINDITLHEQYDAFKYVKKVKYKELHLAFDKKTGTFKITKKI
jgi:archaellin